jgi:ferredoxin
LQTSELFKILPAFGVKFAAVGKIWRKWAKLAPKFKRIRKMIAIYFSSTGNTKHCVKRFIERLGSDIPAV